MATTIFRYILMALGILMNEQTISSSYLTSFAGFPVDYGCLDASTCTIGAISSLSDTIMGYPVEYECMSVSSCMVQSTAITTGLMTTMKTTTTTTRSGTTTPKPPFTPPTCPNKTIGMSCNVSTDPCTMLRPCLNLGTCHINTSLSKGYMCSCVKYFSGTNCEVDARPCIPGVTCLYDGICNETTNETHCICPVGKTGVHCESDIDLCSNVTCQNGGICVSAYGNWSCSCTNPELYSGIYCEIKSSALKTKETSSRSLTGVVVGCIVTVISFILIMDILKYIFKIDPTTKKLPSKKEKQRKKKSNQVKKSVIAVRFQYVHAD